MSRKDSKSNNMLQTKQKLAQCLSNLSKQVDENDKLKQDIYKIEEQKKSL